MINNHLLSPDFYCTYREVQVILKRAAVLHLVQMSQSPCSSGGLNRIVLMEGRHVLSLA
jgi:hypothetical protein